MNDAATHPSARAELATITRDRILRGLAALVRRSSDEVTFELVSTESGVPLRTLYRHFANKEALFAAFWRWANEAIEMPERPTNPEDLVAHIPALFAAFDRDEPLVRAMLHSPHGRSIRLAHAQARRHKFEQALRPVTDALPEASSQRLLASVTALCSAAGWETMKDNWGLSGSAAAEAAQWAIRILIDEARGQARTNAG
jgi:AcrR family transcriptional regulator